MRIIIVEDNKAIKENICSLLSETGIENLSISTASDGEIGLRQIRKESPDLVFIDTDVSKIDGLTVLKQIQEEEILSDVVMISSRAEFDCIKQAMNYGAVQYLLNPIDRVEFKSILLKIEKKVKKTKNIVQFLTPENICSMCIGDWFQVEDTFHEYTKSAYGFTVEEPVEVLLIYLGDSYEVRKQQIISRLKKYAKNKKGFSTHIEKMDSRKEILFIIYHIAEGKSLYVDCKNKIVPMLQKDSEGEASYSFRKVECMTKVGKILPEMEKDLFWEIWLGRGKLVHEGKLKKVTPMPIHFPMELEEEAEQLLRKKDGDGLNCCFEKIMHYLKESPHTPEETKKTLIRLNRSLIREWENSNAKIDIKYYEIQRRIAVAVTWRQIEIEMEKLKRMFVLPLKRKEIIYDNELVEKAMRIIEKYYDQGITLEEVAKKLFISGEYLSTCIKKETGETFSVIIRRLRMEKVKTLLTETQLKLNQIAILSGYSDAKYMSQVFKKEYGMLPNAYRKKNH